MQGGYKGCGMFSCILGTLFINPALERFYMGEAERITHIDQVLKGAILEILLQEVHFSRVVPLGLLAQMS